MVLDSGFRGSEIRKLENWKSGRMGKHPSLVEITNPDQRVLQGKVRGAIRLLSLLRKN